MFKKDLRPALGVAMLMVGVVVGYSATTQSRTPEVARIDTAQRKDGAELSAARKRVFALERLIQRYREELSYVDGVNNDLEQKANH